MKKLLTLLIFIPLVSFGQKTLKEKPEINLVKAEAACGICMLNMQGEECELAVKIKDSNKSVFWNNKSIAANYRLCIIIILQTKDPL